MSVEDDEFMIMKDLGIIASRVTFSMKYSEKSTFIPLIFLIVVFLQKQSEFTLHCLLSDTLQDIQICFKKKIYGEVLCNLDDENKRIKK
jgi:hypothetical protein